ncbi:hypothetical protein [Agromyces aureus]|uniref:Alcohol dehydrogenase-like C-terminal domain-containing protein n=1 Tax=Agromyces aureus TaxID=453304 RepID=A0A191WID9_9MICO|nr:hypothetical protein [Agromyces aureus]ANJ27944.1 hypothetical protein ATC03_15710 [Agromyces aureus]
MEHMKATLMFGAGDVRVETVRAYLEDSIQQVLRGDLDPGRVFDRTVSIDDVPAAYAAMDAREALKVMVAF